MPSDSLLCANKAASMRFAPLPFVPWNGMQHVRCLLRPTARRNPISTCRHTQLPHTLPPPPAALHTRWEVPRQNLHSTTQHASSPHDVNLT